MKGNICVYIHQKDYKMNTGSLVIKFDPGSYNKTILFKMFPKLEVFYSHSQYELVSNAEIEQRMQFEEVPYYILSDTKKKLELSNFEYEIIC